MFALALPDEALRMRRLQRRTGIAAQVARPGLSAAVERQQNGALPFLGPIVTASGRHVPAIELLELEVLPEPVKAAVATMTEQGRTQGRARLFMQSCLSQTINQLAEDCRIVVLQTNRLTESL